MLYAAAGVVRRSGVLKRLVHVSITNLHSEVITRTVQGSSRRHKRTHQSAEARAGRRGAACLLRAITLRDHDTHNDADANAAAEEQDDE